MMARLLALIVGLWLCLPVPEARADDLRGLIQQLNTRDFAALEETVNRIAATGDSRAARVLTALGDGKLYYRKKDKQVFIAEKAEKGRDLFDPITGEFVENVGSRKAKRIGINNSLRRAIRGAMGSPDPAFQRSDCPACRRAVPVQKPGRGCHRRARQCDRAGNRRRNSRRDDRGPRRLRHSV